jgi:hypothetical protein
MPGGRRQPLARAISELAKIRLAAEELPFTTLRSIDLDRAEFDAHTVGGDRAAIEVMQAIGVPVPRHLSKLPYSYLT